jgi:hypothetical protein
VRYAIGRAKLDPRLHEKEQQEWKFSEFSLLVSFNRNDSQQEPHIDVAKPNYQFGMIVTDKSPSTLYYEVPKHNRIQNGTDLFNIWKTIDDTIPDALANLMKDDPDLNDKLRCYGSVFNVTNNEKDEGLKYIRHKQDHVPAGTVLSLPGGQVHAGPASKNGFRAVMFFSATPGIDSETEMYDPDTQYSSVLLAGTTMQLFWRRYHIDQASRVYLLKRLKMYLQNTSLSGTSQNSVRWFEHFVGLKNFQTMLKQMETQLLRDEDMGRKSLPDYENSSNKWWDSFFDRYAAKDDIFPYHFETIEYHGEFRLCSHENLYTIDEDTGKAYRTNIYYREADDRIFMYCYRPDKSGLSIKHEFYEGTDCNEKYRLVWIDENGKKRPWKLAQQRHIRFNGKNGQLFDSDGEHFEAFVRGGNQSDEQYQADDPIKGLDPLQASASQSYADQVNKKIKIS